jgi:hypothetical protein
MTLLENSLKKGGKNWFWNFLKSSKRHIMQRFFGVKIVFFHIRAKSSEFKNPKNGL